MRVLGAISIQRVLIERGNRHAWNGKRLRGLLLWLFLLIRTDGLYSFLWGRLRNCHSLCLKFKQRKILLGLVGGCRCRLPRRGRLPFWEQRRFEEVKLLLFSFHLRLTSLHDFLTFAMAWQVLGYFGTPLDKLILDSFTGGFWSQIICHPKDCTYLLGGIFFKAMMTYI